jgi:hypothetical protein
MEAILAHGLYLSIVYQVLTRPLRTEAANVLTGESW